MILCTMTYLIQDETPNMILQCSTAYDAWLNLTKLIISIRLNISVLVSRYLLMSYIQSTSA